MPVHKVDAKSRFKKVRRKQSKHFETRLQNNDPPSITEVLGLPVSEEFRQRCAAELLDCGEELVRMDLYFKGYVVVGGGGVTAKRDPKTGQYLSCRGSFSSGFHEDLPNIDSILTLDEAVDLALKDEKNVTHRWPVEENKWLVHHITVDVINGKGRLIFDLHYRNDDGSPVHCVLDAVTKVLIDRHIDGCGGCPGGGGYVGPLPESRISCSLL